MMTPERARYLLAHRRYGDLPMAFRRKCDVGLSALDPNGITEEEDRFIKHVWDTMPGHTCYMDAVMRIAGRT